MFNRLNYLVYDYLVARKIQEVPLKSYGITADFYLLSLLCKRDLYQYVAAVLSLLRYCQPAKIIVVNDGTLERSDLIFLEKHVGDIEFRSKDEFQLSGLPTGGCWERISAIAEYGKEKYVMQLDADTLFLKKPEELIKSIVGKESFCLPTISGVTPCDFEAAESFAKAMISVGGHFIQYDLEASLSAMFGEGGHKYIRACAGLAGYAPGVITSEKLSEVSDQCRNIFSDRWNSWGTEQFTSNYILANTKKLNVLPINNYNSVDMYSHDLYFIHFIGSHRFKSGYYLSSSLRVLSEIYS